MKKIIFFIIVLFQFGLLAQDMLPIQQHVDTIPRQLLSKGINHIVDLDIAELVVSMKSIDFKIAEGNIANLTGGRNSAYYNPGEIYSLSQYEEFSTMGLNLLALHEALGATGYDDNEYEKSILMGMLVYLLEEERESLLNSHATKNEFGNNYYLYSSGGGATEVGGGGDGAAAVMKFMVIMLVNKNLQNRSENDPYFGLMKKASFLFELMNIKMEPSQVDSEQIILKPYFAKYHGMKTINRNDKGPVKHQIEFMVEVPRNYFNLSLLIRWKQAIHLAGFLTRQLGAKYECNNEEKIIIHECYGQILEINKNVVNHELVKNSGGMEIFIEDFKNLYCHKEMKR